jgi:hypothetical protein
VLSKIQFVDFAGTENLGGNIHQNKKEDTAETHDINLSLSALGYYLFWIF